MDSTSFGTIIVAMVDGCTERWAHWVRDWPCIGRYHFERAYRWTVSMVSLNDNSWEFPTPKANYRMI